MKTLLRSHLSDHYAQIIKRNWYKIGPHLSNKFIQKSYTAAFTQYPRVRVFMKIHLDQKKPNNYSFACKVLSMPKADMSFLKLAL